MSVKLVNEEIEKFSRGRMPKCYHSRQMGRGKTYTWQAVRGAQRLNAISFPLLLRFTVWRHSLDELKFSIFEKRHHLSGGVRKADLETLDDYISSYVGWRKLTRVVHQYHR